MFLCRRSAVNHIKQSTSTRFIQSATNVRKSTNTDHVVTSPFRKVTIPRVSLSELFWDQAEKWPEKVAVECSATGKNCTYASLRAKSRNFANSLLEKGFQPGDTIAVKLFNVLEYPIIVMGALEAGVVLTTLHPQSTKEETEFQLKKSHASCLITHPSMLSQLDSNLRHSLLVVCVPELHSDGYPANVVAFPEMTKKLGSNSNLSTLHERDLSKTSLLIYSSGTTGFPKGVMLSQRNIVAQTLNRSIPEMNVVPEVTSSRQSTVPCIPPMSTIFSLGMMTKTFFHGGKLVMVPSFHPTSFVALLEKYENIVLHMAPSILTFLALSDSIQREQLKNVTCTITGGAAADVNDIEKFLKKKYQPFLLGYGLTESTAGLTHSPVTNTNYTSVGFLFSNTEAKVIDPETGGIKSRGERGELCFRGNQIMKGYLNDPDATKEAVDEEGWLHTGDEGYFDELGQCYITDRIKDLIKVKGFQVAPAELEYIIKQHPSVYEACVTSVPDHKTGERPVAFVVPRKSVTSFKSKDIEVFVNAKVAPHKQLQRVIVVDSIPKTPSGKLKRRELKKML